MCISVCAALSCGVDGLPLSHTQDRWTALIVASQYGHNTVVDLLLRAGADHSAQTKVGLVLVYVLYRSVLPNERTLDVVL